MVLAAGFISFDLCEWLCRHGHTFVWRVGGNFTLLEQLGWDQERQGDTVSLWPQDCRDRPPIVLRQRRFSSPGGLPVVLLTNEFDAERLSDSAMQEIYALRWDIEVYDRTFKQTWGFAGLSSRARQEAASVVPRSQTPVWERPRVVRGSPDPAHEATGPAISGWVERSGMHRKNRRCISRCCMHPASTMCSSAASPRGAPGGSSTILGENAKLQRMRVRRKTVPDPLPTRGL
ncbi:MAG: transposase [Planctomycetaceae bacterium]